MIGRVTVIWSEMRQQGGIKIEKYQTMFCKGMRHTKTAVEVYTVKIVCLLSGVD